MNPKLRRARRDFCLLNTKCNVSDRAVTGGGVVSDDVSGPGEFGIEGVCLSLCHYAQSGPFTRRPASPSTAIPDRARTDRRRMSGRSWSSVWSATPASVGKASLNDFPRPLGRWLGSAMTASNAPHARLWPRRPKHFLPWRHLHAPMAARHTGMHGLGARVASAGDCVDLPHAFRSALGAFLLAFAPHCPRGLRLSSRRGSRDISRYASCIGRPAMPPHDDFEQLQESPRTSSFLSAMFSARGRSSTGVEVGTSSRGSVNCICTETLMRQVCFRPMSWDPRPRFLSIYHRP